MSCHDVRQTHTDLHTPTLSTPTSSSRWWKAGQNGQNEPFHDDWLPTKLASLPSSAHSPPTEQAREMLDAQGEPQASIRADPRPRLGISLTDGSLDPRLPSVSTASTTRHRQTSAHAQHNPFVAAAGGVAGWRWAMPQGHAIQRKCQSNTHLDLAAEIR